MAGRRERKKGKGIYPYQYTSIASLVPLLNSSFNTAKFGIEIVELRFYKEEVVIGSPQIESLENELKEVESVDEFVLAARYLAEITIRRENRLIPSYVRFYLTSNGGILIEDTKDNGTELVNEDEFNEPTKWKKIITYAFPFAVIIVRFILKVFNISTDDV